MAGPTKGFVFLTYATKRFLPSLQTWLKYIKMHLGALPDAKAVVWLGADMDDEAADLRIAWPEFGFLPVPKTAPASSFEDYWAPQHYAWKLWVLRHTCTDKDRVYIYMDAGVVMARMPELMIEKAMASGLCLVEDTSQKNRYWFSDDFKRELSVQEYELDANQIQAATIVCTGVATPILNEAYALSLRRSVIVGDKWAGMTDKGQPFGHRHDQAILSLLQIRSNVPTVLIEKTQCTHSLKETSSHSLPFYVHRGAFEMTKDIIPLISEIAVINLPRRKDRLDLFTTNHPSLISKMQVHAAVDGRALKLTPAIARVIRPNDFFWKKSVSGCALSHLGLWYKLANAGPDLNSMLILEDDAKLRPGWEDAWTKAAPTVPANWDVLYLGGVLPPNVAALGVATERVAEPWCRIAPNNIFGQREPTRYFHFCAYAYVLSKAGAQKIMKMLEERDGFFTSADHIMCNHHEQLNMFFLDPKLATCTQENDPTYQKSQFNDFNRVDGFDSDLWNNDERWSMNERTIASGSLDIKQALIDATKQTDEALLNRVQPSTVQPKETPNKTTERNLLVRMIGAGPNEKDNIMEMDWLQEMLNCNIYVEPMVKTTAEFMQNEVPCFIVSRQDLDRWQPIFRAFEGDNRRFYAIHLSDEYCKDDVEWYKLSSCLGVIRTYWRTDVGDMKKVITLPLGYAKGAKSASSEKTIAWAFEGTDWFGRAAALQELESVQPHEKKLHAQWAAPEQKTRAEYAAQIARSEFVPCVRGNHFETFRMYEALEAGSVPIYVRTVGDEVFWTWLSGKLPLLEIKSWADAAKYMIFFRANRDHFNKYRDTLMTAWATWKKELKEKCTHFI